MPARLIAERLNRGWSLRTAAQEIGVDRRTLERAERGQGVSPASAFQIAEFYGCQVTDIWEIGDTGGLVPRVAA